MKAERTGELEDRLARGAFDEIKPFGRGLAAALRRAHRDPETGEAVWEVRCFCSPPLAAEKPAILDRYFEDIVTEEVEPGEGWDRISHLPALWDPPIDTGAEPS